MKTLRVLEAAILLPMVIAQVLVDRLLTVGDHGEALPQMVVVQPLAAAAAPAVGLAPPMDMSDMTVVQLRGLARARLGASTKVGGRRIAQATKASLLAALAG